MANAVAPANVVLATTSVSGRIKVSWSWSWEDATGVEISWADTPDAWSSTAGPQTYDIEKKATSWYIDGLELGKTWYVRVRFKKDSDTSPYSARKSINLPAIAPTVPSVPTNVTVTATSIPGRVIVKWALRKTDNADSIEVSWADNTGAWASTSGYSSYKIDTRKDSWYIDNLTTGKTWYIRVRFIVGQENGAWSSITSINIPGSTPVAPTGLKAEAHDVPGRVKLTWNWNWQGAELVEVTWSDSATAWSSTQGYSSQKTDRKTTGWYVGGLQTGKTWYFRIRFTYANGTGPWSNMVQVVLPAAVKKVATKAPSGLTGSRNISRCNFSWKITDDNYGQAQWVGIKYSHTSWEYIEIGKTRTTFAYDFPVQNYYPYINKSLHHIWFAVRGRRANYSVEKDNIKTNYYPQMSEWTIKEWEWYPPNRPTLSAELDVENATIFSWETDVSNDGHKPFTDCEWQSILVRECLETNGAKLAWKASNIGWQTNVVGATGSKRIVEDTELLTTASYTRWFRIRSRGCAGPSEWRYAKHVYTRPKQAVIKEARAGKNPATGYTASVTWEATANASHPIDQTTIEYALVVPAANQAYPTGESWTLAGTSYDTGGKDKKVWFIDDTLDLDECLFYRVNTHHDFTEVYGVPTLVLSGSLKDPTNIEITMPLSGYSPTIAAQNNSEVPDSFLVVVYRRKGKADMICGIIPHGQSSTTVTVPNWSQETAISFGVYAAQGTYQRASRTDSVTQFTVTANMRSIGTIWGTGDVPKAPATVTLAEISAMGKIQVNWAWSWASATQAEISWSDSRDAWQSTKSPESFVVEQKTTKWYISDLEMGKKWYVRVRLLTDDLTGPWSNIVDIDLASTPQKPILTLSEGVITTKGSVTAYWTYATKDETSQQYADVCKATINGSNITYGRIIGHAETSQSVILYAENVGWQAGEEYSLCVRVASESGRISPWSDPVTVRIAEPLTATITTTSLTTVDVPDDEDEGTVRTVTALTEMPLTVTVTGAGAGGTTGVSIVRAESYHMERPDEDTFNGYEGEAVAVYTQTGEGSITITNDELIGMLDDGAQYRIVATVQDGLGQSAETSQEFEVHWEHQALMPQATAEIDQNDYIAMIQTIAPEGALTGDVVDIYRLSADKPELIVQNGIFGETYVDPYPTIGEYGGHRVVFKTDNGDYITKDNQPAWIDLQEDEGDMLSLDKTIIDFDGKRVLLSWNMDISSSWTKDFSETHYLGGSVQGDWNASVGRTGTVGAVAVTAEDQELIKSMRRLAAYPGICHVRTPEGSSYAADVQVSEDMSHSTGAKIATFSVTITRVDPEGFEGMLLSEWEEAQS